MKIVDIQSNRIKIRNICSAYHKILKKVKSNNKRDLPRLMDEKLMAEYKEIISLAETKILKAINYQFNI